jgi:uncharacterized protein (DUF1697 family)
MARQIALLRGINLGARRKVPMARLRELIDELGYEDVRTYVQSGNVVFSGPGGSPGKVARRIEKALAGEFGFDVPVVLRSRDELAAVVAADPLGDVASDPAKYLVSFLAEAVGGDRLDDLDPDDFAPESFRLVGRELYMWLPGGMQKSRLAKAISDERLGTVATARNWRTVEKLLALADAG